MPETGGKKVAADLRTALPDLRKLTDALQLQVGAAITRYTAEAANLRKAVAKIEDDADHMAQAANEILGNNPPEDESGKD